MILSSTQIHSKSEAWPSNLLLCSHHSSSQNMVDSVASTSDITPSVLQSEGGGVAVKVLAEAVNRVEVTDCAAEKAQWQDPRYLLEKGPDLYLVTVPPYAPEHMAPAPATEATRLCAFPILPRSTEFIYILD